MLLHFTSHWARVRGWPAESAPSRVSLVPWALPSPQAYYAKGCARTSEPCLGPTSRFYPIVNNGLDTMIKSYLECADDLIIDVNGVLGEDCCLPRVSSVCVCMRGMSAVGARAGAHPAS